LLGEHNWLIGYEVFAKLLTVSSLRALRTVQKLHLIVHCNCEFFTALLLGTLFI